MKLLRELRIITNKFFPIFANKVMYRVKMKKSLNYKNPKTFNEKINYLKTYNYPNNQKIIDCSDKFKVREYIRNKGLDSILVKLYMSWNSVSEIDFFKLPKKFVLKCNHGCGYNILCNNKDNFNINNAKSKLKKWMHEDFGLVSGEKHYSKINKKIICEEYLEDDILDFKFFCFKGIPKFFYISQNIKGDFHNMQSDFFYCDGKMADFYRTDHKRFDEIPQMPNNLDEMLKISKILSEDFEFVRVDLFNVKGKIYFSELTFSPCSGFMPLYPEYIDLKYGELINLKNI